MKNVPSVEVITFTYNESLHIDYLVKWYSARFRNLKITVYDNHSTDDTVAKARSLGCKVISWGHASHRDERLFTNLKNQCFKESVSDYFVICDVDELLDVTELDLIAKQPAAVQGIGYQMVGTNNINLTKSVLAQEIQTMINILCSNDLKFWKLTTQTVRTRANPISSKVPRKK